jgi:Ubiquitin carboxyl-terminal hydrolase
MQLCPGSMILTRASLQLLLRCQALRCESQQQHSLLRCLSLSPFSFLLVHDILLLYILLLLFSDRAAADPIRLVIVLPRLSDVSDLRKAICHMLSPAAPKSSSNASSQNLAAKIQNGAVSAGQVILPDNLTLLDCSPEGEGGLLRTILEDRESILHLIEAISRGASTSASASASASNLLQRTESGVDVYLRTGLPVESPNPRLIAARHRVDSANGSPAQTGGDPLARAVLENTSGGMVLHCVAVENPKNIPFIFSLSTSRLGFRNAGATLFSQNTVNSPADAAGSKNGPEEKGKDGTREGKESDQRAASAQSSNPYTDEAEYLERHLDKSEGDLVTDLDFEMPPDAQKTDDRKNRNVKKDNPIFARWPKGIDGLVLGRRVDALDHRGYWFAGTVMDKWNVSAEELQEVAEKNSSSSSSSSNNIIASPKGRAKKEVSTPSRHGSNNIINRDKDRNRGPKAVGWNIRVHFDSFSDKWDEWFSSADFEAGRVSPIYSFSHRKLKVIGVVVVQRQITLRNQGSGSVGSDTSNQEVLNVKVFGYPIVLHCESFRSCEHVHRLIAEQSMRYAQPGQLKAIAEASLNRYNSKNKNQSQESDAPHSKSSSEQPVLPFTVRIISTTSAFASDNLEGLETEMGIPRTEEGRRSVMPRGTAERLKEPCRSNSGLDCVTGAAPTFYSVMDRANGFQAWEGSYFPRDPVRPLCNLVHPKLLVVVDWHWNTTRAPMIGQGKGVVAYRDHESFLKYVSAFIPPASAILSRSASVMDAESNGAPVAPTDPPPNLSARPPISTGNPSLVDCLKSFTGSEELDEDSWHCDHCRKLSCGSVSSSLSRLPDLLIMHIKRFGMTARFREKIRTKVTFPLTSLNMKPFTTPLTATGES